MVWREPLLHCRVVAHVGVARSKGMLPFLSSPSAHDFIVGGPTGAVLRATGAMLAASCVCALVVRSLL